jgi:hypothetical protein
MRRPNNNECFLACLPLLRVPKHDTKSSDEIALEKQATFLNSLEEGSRGASCEFWSQFGRSLHQKAATLKRNCFN